MLKQTYYQVVKKISYFNGTNSDPQILLLDEPFAALDVMTIKMLQNIIINLQSNSGISIILCDHQARDLLNCVDVAAILTTEKLLLRNTFKFN